MGVYFVPKLYDHPVEPKLPYSVLSNCYAWVRLRYPTLQGTLFIQKHLQTEPAKVAVMQYGNLEHYAVVEEVGTSSILISETNYGGDFYQKRRIQMNDIHLRGYFKI